jgi:hypothetical protein
VIRDVGDEGGAVVGLEDEWWSALSEECLEDGEGRFGRFVFDGDPGELVVAGEVADGEGLGVVAIDGERRVGVVDGPDGAGAVPGQDMECMGITFFADAAVAGLEVVEFAAGHVPEAR